MLFAAGRSVSSKSVTEVFLNVSAVTVFSLTYLEPVNGVFIFPLSLSLKTKTDEITDALPWSRADTGKSGPRCNNQSDRRIRYRAPLENSKRDMLNAATKFL